MSPSTSIPVLHVEGIKLASSSSGGLIDRLDHSESSSWANSNRSSSGTCEHFNIPDESSLPSKASNSTESIKPDSLEGSLWSGGRNLFDTPQSHAVPAGLTQGSNHHTRHSPTPEKPEINVTDTLESHPQKFFPQLLETSIRTRRNGDVPSISTLDRNDSISALHGLSRLAVEDKSPTRLSSSNLSQSPKHGEGKLGQYHPHRYPLAHSHSRGVAVDDNPTGFLLERAAKAAQRQIHDRALWAFPNDERHLPISHYVDQSETPAPSSRGSLHDFGSRSNSVEFELSQHSTLHQRRHFKRENDFERLEMRRKLQRRSEVDTFSNNTSSKPVGGGSQSEKDPEMAAMQRGASPPLLGQDIVFPRSESPPPARFDITQGTEFLKRTVCYLSEQTGTSPPASAGLWTPSKSEPAESPQSSVPVSRTTSHCGGLWGAIDASLFTPNPPIGISTPRIEEDGNLDSGYSSNILRHLPPSPPPSTGELAALEERLAEATLAQEAEAELIMRFEEDFDDAFVTQVYNYLSLGYPAVARDYDEELSKISGLPVDELRQDDRLPSSRGYVRLNDEQVFDGVTEDMCARWKALKLYVHEWARQQPGMIQGPEAGYPERKGSWGA